MDCAPRATVIRHLGHGSASCASRRRCGPGPIAGRYVPLVPGENPLAALVRDLCDIGADILPGAAGEVGFV